MPTTIHVNEQLPCSAGTSSTPCAYSRLHGSLWLFAIGLTRTRIVCRGSRELRENPHRSLGRRGRVWIVIFRLSSFMPELGRIEIWTASVFRPVGLSSLPAICTHSKDRGRDTFRN
jgi:hypothetical protein